MTVAKLIEELKKMPQDAVVTIPNRHLYDEGYYEVTKLLNYDDEVVVETDYKCLCTEEGEQT